MTRGADGLAFWYVMQPLREGTVFGNAEDWKGVGIFFDTFDNDGLGDFPVIYGVSSDDVQTFPHDSDGIPVRFGACELSYRTSNYDGANTLPAPFIIRYLDGVLSLIFDTNYLTPSDPSWQECFSKQISLPSGGYFGLSAATGEVSDHHNVISFVTYSLQGKLREPEDPEKSKASQEHLEYEMKVFFPNRHGSVPMNITVNWTLGTGPDGNITTTDILQRIGFLKDKHGDLGIKLNEGFTGLQKRLEVVEYHATSHLKTLVKTMSQLSDRLVEGKTAVTSFERIVADVSRSLDNFQHKLRELDLHIAGLKTHTNEFQKVDDVRTAQVSDMISSHSTSFWILFVLFQVLFISVCFNSYRIERQKRKDFM
eukprot:TRINITY_DN2554_c0_g2_i2.p1 TRINITY_DN2554_c0_g2~~TRINITY_DN2554_c0_g2_i2.p1  ORF type:complete len:368 (-),score=57.74 TRINITY_DN2554_c0_g2_i2:175-1278(-)